MYYNVLQPLVKKYIKLYLAVWIIFGLTVYLFLKDVSYVDQACI